MVGSLTGPGLESMCLWRLVCPGLGMPGFRSHARVSQMSSEVAIKVENLSKCYHIYDKPRDRLLQMLVRSRLQYYKEFWALKNVSFEIEKGETVGIIGRNGSGKSTLLQLICGTLTPTSGSIQTNGRIAALLELGSGFNPEFTGRENVYLNGSILGLSKEEIDARFEKIATFAEIGEFIDQPVKTYSSGMFVRLAFAIQANVDPEILIVDEALAVGDAQFVHRCMLRFHELQRRGTTIILVSHDSSSIKRLCDRAFLLKSGQLVLHGDSTKVVDAYLQDLFDLKPLDLSSDATSRDSCAEDSFSSILSLSLPLGDGRYGNRSIEMVGMSLTDSAGQAVVYVEWNSTISLLLEIKNKNLQQGTKIGCGYIIRDSKGVEIASASTWQESIDIYAPNQSQVSRVMITIKIPMLMAGSYSLTPSTSSCIDKANPRIEDRIQNAYLFEVVANMPITTPIRFDSKFTVI